MLCCNIAELYAISLGNGFKCATDVVLRCGCRMAFFVVSKLA